MKDIKNFINESQKYTEHSVRDIWNDIVRYRTPSNNFLKDLITFGAKQSDNSEEIKNFRELAKEIVNKMGW